MGIFSQGYTAPVRMGTNADAPIKLGVNGFGRIGRQVVRIAMDRESMVLKHINSPMTPDYMKYLLEHDTVHGRFSGTCEIKGDGLLINGMDVSLSATRDPTEIPWAKTGVEYVCESTGAFTTTEGCMKHIEGGAKHVIISAPGKDAETPTLVVGVNEDEYESSMAVVSCASCTTNGLAPIVKVVNEKFGQHHPVLHRRGQGRRQGLPDHEGQADRHGFPRADRRRVRCRPDLRAGDHLHVR